MIDNQNEKIELNATMSESSTIENMAEETTKSDQDKISNNSDESKPQTSVKMEEKIKVEDVEISKNKTGSKMTNNVLDEAM